MTLLSKLAGTDVGRKALSLDLLDHNGWTIDDGFMIPPLSVSSTPNQEDVEQSFASYVTNAYKSNGVIFACILARMLPFSEARFQFQPLNGGRPSDRLFGTPALSLLENPWPNGTTGELLSRMEQDASLAGNFYATIVGEGANRRIRRLRPDWITIISGVVGDPDGYGDAFALDASVLGYIYDPGRRGTDTVLLTPDQVVHYSPIPDPDAQWRGMSWLTPVLREISSDSATTLHKLRFFENGATPPFVVTYEQGMSPETFTRYVTLFNEQHRGVENANKVLHLGGGADAKSIGTNLQQLDFKSIQGAGETRIAAAAGVGAIIARLSEGLQGSSLNAGNYNAAKRQFADMTIRPLWRIAAASLSKFAEPPAGSRLWYDARDIAFLKEDEKDSAEIQSNQAATIASLVQAGFTPDSVVAAVKAGDFTLLAHSGLYSVQLQPAGAAAQGGAT